MRGPSRLPLNALRVFEAVATHEGHAEAAEALHVTPAAVSMQVKSLEEYLQVRLFQRAGRRLALTTEGEALLPGVRRGLAELQQAMQGLRQSRQSGLLRVSTIGSFMQKWLMPRLPAFAAHCPDIDLQVHTSTAQVSFNEGDFHAAIRLAPAATPGLYSEQLLAEWYVPVCCPELLARLGPVRSIDDLKRYTLLRSTDESWALWADPGRAGGWPQSGVAFDEALTLQAAAEQGQGLALTRWTLAARDLANGRLALASPRAVAYPRSYWFVCPKGYAAMPKVARLLEWLRAQCAAFPAPPGATTASATAAIGAARAARPAKAGKRPVSRARPRASRSRDGS